MIVRQETCRNIHVLYRFYSKTGQLLYVGITMNPPGRFGQHRDTKAWWSQVASVTLENYESRADLESAERRAIRVEHPMHNVTHKILQRPSTKSVTQSQNRIRAATVIGLVIGAVFSFVGGIVGDQIRYQMRTVDVSTEVPTAVESTAPRPLRPDPGPNVDLAHAQLGDIVRMADHDDVYQGNGVVMMPDGKLVPITQEFETGQLKGVFHVLQSQ